jgi:ELWxxDGT repeat protein
MYGYDHHCLPAALSRIAITLAALFLMGAGQNLYLPPSSEPRHLYVFRDHLYFSADDGIHGRELWRIDGAGKCELVHDTTPGAAEVDIDSFHEFGGHLYFRVAETKNSGDLWRTDGSAAGTSLIFDCGFEQGLQGISTIVGAGEKRLYFCVGEERASNRLWSTDGTTQGTYPATLPDGGDAPLLEIYSGIVQGDTYFFGASNSDPQGLWRSDGIAGTTREVLGMHEVPNYFFSIDDRRFLFSGGDEATGRELWISEGTPETTRLLKDIYPGPETSEPQEYTLLQSAKDGLLILFAATTLESGRELWQTDGTPEGTRLRADLFPGAGSSSPSRAVEVGEYHYLIAIGDGVGKEMWQFDPTSGKYSLARDIVLGPAGSSPYQLCSVGSRLYFSALSEEDGEELWAIDPPSGAPRLFQDINPGSAHAFPYYSTEFAGQLVTVATGDTHGRELWIHDEKNDEMVIWADIKSDTSVNPSSSPNDLTAAGEWLYFSANDIEHGTELWRTDGTSDGTSLVKDIYSGSASSDPAELTALGDSVYFSAENGVHGSELWRSDGTAAGTAMVYDIYREGSANPRNLSTFKGMLLFSAYDPETGEEPWVLEPGKNPRILRDIGAGASSSSPSEFTAWKDHIYFQAEDGTRGRELWRSDGTLEGTVLVRDIVSAPFEQVSLHSPQVYRNQLYFSSDLEGRGRELWALDDVENRIRLVRDIVSGDAYDVVNRLTESPGATR